MPRAACIKTFLINAEEFLLEWLREKGDFCMCFISFMYFLPSISRSRVEGLLGLGFLIPLVSHTLT